MNVKMQHFNKNMKSNHIPAVLMQIDDRQIYFVTVDIRLKNVVFF